MSRAAPRFEAAKKADGSQFSVLQLCWIIESRPELFARLFLCLEHCYRLVKKDLT